MTCVASVQLESAVCPPGRDTLSPPNMVLVLLHKQALPFSAFQSFFFLLMLPETLDFGTLSLDVDNPRLTVNRVPTDTTGR